VDRQLLFRSILRKQFESLEAIAKLSSEKQGHISVSLLRPMCEELIWLEYLLSMSPQDAELLLLSMGRIGIYETFCAQRNYAARKHMGDLGFPAKTEGQLAQAAAVAEQHITGLAAKLQWPNKRRGILPTVRFLAASVKRDDVYTFLYHATSRVVHFSVPELMRRIWGRPGEMTISSNNYERYWADFSLYWGGWIYSLVFLRIAPALTGTKRDLEDSKLVEFDKAAKTLLGGGGIPILTIEEIAWPF
jgi:hypothetical protein